MGKILFLWVWIHTFAASTEELCLSGDGSNILDLLQAPNVKSLHLETCSTMKKLVDTTSIDRWRFDVLYLSNLPKLEEICDVPIARESNSFKNLKELNLVKLPALEHLWNNPNQNISLSNLSSITIQECGLCSLAIAMDSLLQLQDLRIDSCRMMKQVFSRKRDGKKSHITVPQLKKLELSDLESLTTFCQEIGSIEFPMLTRIEIRKCPRITSLVSSIENDQNSASTYLFCSQQVTFGRLRELTIEGCNNISKIWCHQMPDSFSTGLEQLTIVKCDSIRGLFSSAIARNFKKLECLRIINCKEMVKVIEDEEEIIGETNCPLVSLFPSLRYLTLVSLPKLESFCEWRCDLELPMLEDLDILECPMMKVFAMGSEHIECRKLTSIESPMGPDGNNDDTSPLFCSLKATFGRLKELHIQEYKKELHKYRNKKDLCIQGYNNISKIWCHQIPDSFFTGVEELKIVECDSIRSLFSSAVARNLVKLEYLKIKDCEEMVKVIEDEEEITGETNCPLVSLFPSLRYLKLVSLPKLESFYEWRCDLELSSLKIRGCPMMKVFTMGSLISAHKLEHIECRKLTSIESLIGPDGNNDDTSPLFCSVKVTFGRLRELTIGGYNNISKMWCHQMPHNFFTGLEELEIVECDSIRGLFSSAIARNLKKLEDLRIINCKEMVKVIEDEEEITGESNCPLVSLFPSLRYLTLDSLPKLESFCEWRCDLELPMLMELSIKECPMMKVFAMGSEHIECRKLTSIESPMGPDGNSDDTSPLFCSLKVTFGRLRELTIEGCNNISKIWCHQMPDSFSSGLEELDIVECDSIRGLFSSAIARNLKKLKRLRIINCKEMVKVIEDEDEITGETNCPLVSLFPSLRYLRLVSLPKLESFCEWRCDLEFPVLHSLDIKCPKLTSIESPMGLDGNNDVISPLFCSLKVTFGRLRELTIGGYSNVSKIWCHQIPNGFFTRLKELKITECDNVRSLFPSTIARNLVNLKDLTIERCKEIVKVIDDDDEINRESSCPLLLFPSLEYLTLESLPKLVSFCKWRCVIELPMLDYVSIDKCPTMKVFTMGSLISTPKLGKINIEYQNEDVGDLNEFMKLHSSAERGDVARVEIVE